MPRRFKKEIQRAQQNRNLLTALNNNAERRINVRKSAFQSLQNPEELRQAAKRIRSEIVAKLPEYLDQFKENALNNGFFVHVAQDAQDANDRVLEITRRHSAQLVVKSKSMLTEEIGLNNALEAQGIEVVETDLGEFIVQIRGEKPSHIITPAVHLRREDVGKTFQAHFNIPYTDDVGILTDVARKNIRGKFLSADVGITGVNFGIADTGGICLLTNEGNGRMVSTIPRVHIAIMGMERLVRSMDDLAVMLTLLPRSATGQKLTVYTTLIHSPKKGEEADGPLERHLVIVDNGRLALRDTGLAEILNCIRCGACLNACPVFREIGGHAYVSELGCGSVYPGPLGSVLSPGLFGHKTYGNLSRASSLCGACREACPVDIDLPKLILRARTGGLTSISSRRNTHIPRSIEWAMRIFTWMMVSGSRVSKAQIALFWFGGLLKREDRWIQLPGFSGWGRSRNFPIPRERSFRDQFKERIVSHGELSWVKPSRYQPQERLETVLASSQPDELSLVERFELELKTLGGTMIQCSRNEIAGEISRLLGQEKVTTICAWSSDNLPEGLISALSKEGIYVSFDKPQEASVGLTGALAGIAETGSVVVISGSGRPQATSLLPEIHLVLLDRRTIAHHLSEVLDLEAVKHAGMTVIVSGPSRTADIEMTLTIGVHGPKKVIVVCYNDGSAGQQPVIG